MTEQVPLKVLSFVKGMRTLTDKDSTVLQLRKLTIGLQQTGSIYSRKMATLQEILCSGLTCPGAILLSPVPQ